MSVRAGDILPRVRGAAVPAALAAALVGAAASTAGERRIEGETMGTRYAVRVVVPAASAGSEASGAWSEPALRRAVEEVLERVDAALSTWRGDSEVLRFNRSRDDGWLPVSAETARVVAAARVLAERSGGAFDPTVAPLVRLWGFGAGGPTPLPPDPAQLAAARAAVGYRALRVRREPPALRKDRPALELDLSGIAKGHAVDAVAARLREAGSRDFLVEVGGEIRAAGSPARGGAWRVAIEDPLARPAAAAPSAPVASPAAWLALRDAAVATSGAVRNFRVQDGARLAHVLDPRRGAPVASRLLSVSVVAPAAMQADGWATALLAAGPEEGWALARREELAALFVSLRDGGSRIRATPAFEAHVWNGSLHTASGEVRP